MERRDVRIKALHRTGEDELVQLRRWQCLVEPRPTTIPWLELGAGQARLDLHHAIPEIVEGPLVGAGRALEVQPDLEPPCARVMPDLEVELGMAVMELDQAAVAAARLEGLQLLRKPRLDALAEPRKEVCGGQRHVPTARIYLLVQFRQWLTSRRLRRTKAATASAHSTSTRGCSRTASSSSAAPSTTTSPTWWWLSSSTSRPTTRRRRSRSTSTPRAAPSARDSPSTTRCSTSSRPSRRCASGAPRASARWS